MSEKQDLERAVDEFAAAMKARLNERRVAGDTGWRLGAKGIFSREDAKECLLLNAIQGTTRNSAKDLVDTANYAMMLHRKMA